MAANAGPDHYHLLGLQRNCTAEDIKRSYRSKALQYHPDKNPGKEDLFKLIVSAYQVLSDSAARSRYDATLPYVGSYQRPTGAPKPASRPSSAGMRAPYTYTAAAPSPIPTPGTSSSYTNSARPSTTQFKANSDNAEKINRDRYDAQSKRSNVSGYTLSEEEIAQLQSMRRRHEAARRFHYPDPNEFSTDRPPSSSSSSDSSSRPNKSPPAQDPAAPAPPPRPQSASVRRRPDSANSSAANSMNSSSNTKKPEESKPPQAEPTKKQADPPKTKQPEPAAKTTPPPPPTEARPASATKRPEPQKEPEPQKAPEKKEEKEDTPPPPRNSQFPPRPQPKVPLPTRKEVAKPPEDDTPIAPPRRQVPGANNPALRDMLQMLKKQRQEALEAREAQLEAARKQQQVKDEAEASKKQQKNATDDVNNDIGDGSVTSLPPNDTSGSSSRPASASAGRPPTSRPTSATPKAAASAIAEFARRSSLNRGEGVNTTSPPQQTSEKTNEPSWSPPPPLSEAQKAPRPVVPATFVEEAVIDADNDIAKLSPEDAKKLVQLLEHKLKVAKQVVLLGTMRKQSDA